MQSTARIFAKMRAARATRLLILLFCGVLVDDCVVDLTVPNITVKNRNNARAARAARTCVHICIFAVKMTKF